jgi:hypothetical protein
MTEILTVNIEGKVTKVTREELNKFLAKYPTTNFYIITSDKDA